MIDLSRTRNKALLGAILVLVLALVAWRVSVYRADQAAKRNAAAKEIAVDAVAATRVDVPNYWQGLGTVQAFYTVTVTARVDGECSRLPSPRARMCARATCSRR